MSERALPKRPRGRGAWLAIVTGVLIVTAYASIWRAGFVWDDDAHLTTNPCIVGPLGLKEAWTTPAANYFPLVLTHFAVLHAIFGLEPMPYHAINLLLHLANVGLLWLVLQRLRVRGAWLGATLWGIHPVAAESVAWVSEFTNTQSCFFFLIATGAFLAWLEAAPERRARWYAVVLVAGAAAMLSKPSTVMLPAVLVLCVAWRRVPWRRRIVLALAPLFAMAAAWSGWTIWEQRVHSGAAGAEWSLTLVQRGLIAGADGWFYLGKLLWPQSLSFIYPRWTVEATDVRWYLPLAAAAGVAVCLARRQGGGGRALAFGGAVFVVLLFPVLGFFNVYYFRFSFVADHFQYLGAMAPLALLGAGLSGGASWLRAAHPLAIGSVLVGFAVMTALRAAEFVSAETLWRATLRKNPACWLAHNELALLRERTPGGRAAAIAGYETALRLKPDYVDAHYNLANLLADDPATHERAIAGFAAALRTNPRFYAGHANLAALLAKIPERAAEAVAHYEAALPLAPQKAFLHSDLATVLARLGRTAEALAHHRAALQAEPANATLRFNFANFLAAQPGGRDAAIAEFKTALRLQPDHGPAAFNLATALAAQPGGMAEALPWFDTAVRLLPDSPVAHYGFAGVLLRQTPQIDRAIAEYERALQLAPALVEAHNEVAVAYARRGQLPRAIEHLEAALRLRPDFAPARENLAAIRAAQAGTPR